MATFNCQKLREVAGIDICGLLGMPVFDNWIVQLDFDGGCVRLFPLDSQDSSWGDPISLRRLANRRLVIENISIGETTDSFLLDTGSTRAITLRRALYDELEKNGKLRTIQQAAVANASGGQTEREGRLTVATKLGRFEHQDLLVGASSANKIGLNYLRRFVATIDAPSDRMYLRKGKSFSAMKFLDMSGLQLVRLDGRVVVEQVDNGSPAMLAGIRAADELVELDRNPVNDLRLTGIRKELQSEPGRLVRVTVNRDGHQLDFSFRLREGS